MLKDDLLEAISLAEEGSWDQAHSVVQDIENEYAYWIHANLHREEGDISNSRYWYSRAGRDYTDIEYSIERDEIKKEVEKKL